MDNFFVILDMPDGGCIPLVGDKDEIALFATRKEASERVRDILSGERERFGYEIFECGSDDWGGIASATEAGEEKNENNI